MNQFLKLKVVIQPPYIFMNVLIIFINYILNEALGFLKEKKLGNYYMNGNSAYRLKLYFNSPEQIEEKFEKYLVLTKKYKVKPDPKYNENDLITNSLFKDIPNYWDYYRL